MFLFLVRRLAAYVSLGAELRASPAAAAGLRRSMGCVHYRGLMLNAGHLRDRLEAHGEALAWARRHGFRGWIRRSAAAGGARTGAELALFKPEYTRPQHEYVDAGTTVLRHETLEADLARFLAGRGVDTRGLRLGRANRFDAACEDPCPAEWDGAALAEALPLVRGDLEAFGYPLRAAGGAV